MRINLKSALLSILGAGVILGSSLCPIGCERQQEAPKKKEKEMNVIFENYTKDQRLLIKKANCFGNEFYFSLDATTPKNGERLSIYPYMRTLVEKENINLREPDAQKHNLPIKANLSDSNGYIVFSQPVKEVVSGDRGDIVYTGRVREAKKVVDKRLRKELIGFAKKSKLEGKMFGKTSEVYQLYYGEDRSSHIQGPTSPRRECKENFMWAFSTPIHFEYERASPDGLSVAIIGDFIFERTNGDRAREVFCVTMARTPAQFPSTQGYWLIPSKNAVLNMDKVYDETRLYTRSNREGVITKKYPTSKYDSRKDSITLDPTQTDSPRLARKIINGETTLQMIYPDGNKETLRRISEQESYNYR